MPVSTDEAMWRPCGCLQHSTVAAGAANAHLVATCLHLQNSVVNDRLAGLGPAVALQRPSSTRATVS
jgi:hypothetical protein